MAKECGLLDGAMDVVNGKIVVKVDAESVYTWLGSHLKVTLPRDVITIHQRVTMLAEAMADHYKVRIDYWDKKGELTARNITPAHFLRSAEDDLCVRAWCDLRDGWRTFVIKNIAAMQSTKEKGVITE